MYHFQHHQNGLGMALGVTPTGVVASRSCRAVTDRTLKTSCAFLNERAWLCCPGGGGGGGEHNSGACCHGNPGQLMRHQSQNKSFSVFAASDFFPPLATIRWYRCLVFVTLQPSQKLGRITEPLKKTELCGLRSVNGQEEGRRKLVAVQGGGWKRSCAVPGVSGRHSHCFVGRTQGGELSFLSHLLGLSLEMAI